MRPEQRTRLRPSPTRARVGSERLTIGAHHPGTWVSMATMLLALLIAACASHHTPAPVVQVVDVPPILQAAAELVEALPRSTPAVCIAEHGVASALRAAADVVAAGGLELPAVEVDVAGCGPMPAGIDVPAEVAPVLALLPLVGQLAGGRLDCRAQAVVVAATAYAGTLTPEVLAEFAAPDGLIHVPAVTVDLSGC